jgi:glycine oxidase
MSRKTEAVVVGGGIAGCVSAIELAARGAAVTLIERDQPGVGATGASAGMLAPQYETAEPDAAFKFGLACREAYPAFVERLQALASWDVGFRSDGMLVVNRSAAEAEAASRALAFQREAGLTGEILSCDDARRVHGAVATDVESWLWLPAEAQVDTQRLAVALADAVQAAGVTLVRGIEVTGLSSEAGRVNGVRLADGRAVDATVVVVAAGAWSRNIDGLPRALPVRPVRGQILRLLPAEPLPWPLVCDHQGRYLVPRANGSILIGSTMEDAGYDDRVTEDGRELLASAAASLIPALEDTRIIESWAGLRPLSADSRPILGPDPDLEGLLYATGHGRNGILFAPLTGRAVAELALTGDTDVRWEEFGIGRFRALHD